MSWTIQILTLQCLVLVLYGEKMVRFTTQCFALALFDRSVADQTWLYFRICCCHEPDTLFWLIILHFVDYKEDKFLYHFAFGHLWTNFIQDWCDNDHIKFKLCCLKLVWVALILTQVFRAWETETSTLFLTKLAAAVDQVVYTVEACWSDWPQTLLLLLDCYSRSMAYTLICVYFKKKREKRMCKNNCCKTGYGDNPHCVYTSYQLD